jgi:hypothetical protein
MKFFLLLVLSLFSVTANSTNLSFLYDSPMRSITADDWKMIENTSETVLSSYPNHKKAAWQNPHSGNSGYLEALNTTQRNGMPCRDLKFFNHTKVGDSVYTFTFCHYNIGWKIPGDAD